MELKDPRQALIGSGEIEERRRPHGHTISGRGNGPAGKKKGWKEKCVDSNSLANNYRWTFKMKDMMWGSKIRGGKVNYWSQGS
jgi:hypothetical protein